MTYVFNLYLFYDCFGNKEQTNKQTICINVEKTPTISDSIEYRIYTCDDFMPANTKYILSNIMNK